MQRILKNTDKIFNGIAFTLLVLGIGLRIIVYLQNRSLFLDEANLARNIVERNFLQFFSNLDYDQYAPPLFLGLEKFIWHIFGSNELSLRLLSLIAGIAALCLFYRLNQLLKWDWAVFGFLIFLFGFSVYFVRYATEVKQYSTDILLCLGLIYGVMQSKAQVFSTKMLIIWALIGAMAIWFSMPVVFVLTAVGIYLGIKYWEQVGIQRAWYIIFPIIVWLISFGLYYLTILSKDLSRTDLVEYHSTYFFPLIPTNFEDLSKAGSLALSIFRTAFGYTIIAYAISIGLSLVGIWGLWKKDKALTLLLLLPILSCLLASGLGLYSLIPRMTLFFIPLLLLLVGYGFQMLFKWKGNWGKVISFALMIPLVPLKKGGQFFFQPYEISEIRPVLSHLHQQQKEQAQVYIDHEAVPPFLFYTELHDDKAVYQLENVRLGNWQSQPSFNLTGAPVWVVFSHLISEYSLNKREQVIGLLTKEGKEIQSFQQKGASCHLFIK